jgi:large subunit ribosomal protein L6
MSTKFKVDARGADVEVKKDAITVKGKGGTLKADIRYPFLSVKNNDGVLEISAKGDVAYQKAIAGTLAAEVRNIIKGVETPYVAELELVYMHFPSALKVAGNKVIVENFVGERKPREIDIMDGVDVKINGTKITLSGIDKYKVGQMAANLESKVNIKNKDRRVFKDGIFITKKP